MPVGLRDSVRWLHDSRPGDPEILRRRRTSAGSDQ